MRLFDFIPAHMEVILCKWEEFARDIWPQDLPDARILRDHAEEMLMAVAADMRTPQTDSEQREKSVGKGGGSRDDNSVDQSSSIHAESRVESGFDLLALVSEYRALRASILDLWSVEPHPDADERTEDMTRFNEAVDQLLAESVVTYTERVDHSREIFLGILGHDLRSPLSAVTMGAGILAEQPELSAFSRKMADQVVISVSAMTRMISDLLDFTGTRLGAKMTITRKPMDLEKLGHEVLEEIRLVNPSRTFTFNVRADGNGNWDRSRLRQLISNLLGNALHHGSTDTPIELFIDGSGDPVILGVRNQGKPIPRKEMSAIFDPMRRHAEDALGRPVGSIGLGLYIARAVVQAHGGTISVTSNKEETAFHVRIPRTGERSP